MIHLELVYKGDTIFYYCRIELECIANNKL